MVRGNLLNTHIPVHGNLEVAILYLEAKPSGIPFYSSSRLLYSDRENKNGSNGYASP